VGHGIPEYAHARDVCLFCRSASGIMDSLLVVEFFFLEQLRGLAIEAEGFPVASISMLRKAYQLVAM
jgi:hypothetical protein